MSKDEFGKTEGRLYRYFENISKISMLEKEIEELDKRYDNVDNKLSYEAQKEQNKKIRKLEKQVADCETLIERLEKEVAEWLEANPKVKWVNYCGLKSSKYYAGYLL